MKILLKRLLYVLFKLYPYSFSAQLNRYLNILYTHWMRKNFARLGDNTYIERGLRLLGGSHIIINNSVSIRRYANLSAWNSYMGEKYHPSLSIRDYCSIGEYVNISCVDKIILGKSVLLGRWVTIIDHAHGGFIEDEMEVPPMKRTLYSKGGIIIDDNVWIADKVTICPNVHIYTGAVVGANSVVTKDVPPYTMVAGCPARVIKVLRKGGK